MYRPIKSSILGALLFGSCTLTDDGIDRVALHGVDSSITSYSTNNANVGTKSNPGLEVLVKNSGRSSHSNPGFFGYGVRGIDLIETTPEYARIGPFKLSADLEKEALGVKLPFLPRIDLPIRNYADESVGFDSSFNRRNWMVGGNYTGEDNHYPEELPLSTLGRVAKALLWDAEIVKPVRSVASEISSIADSPAELIFGKGVESNFEVKLDSEIDRVGFSWKIKFPNGDHKPYFFKIEQQYALTGEEESATWITFGF